VGISKCAGNVLVVESKRLVCTIGNCTQDAPTKLTYVVLHILMKKAHVQDRFVHESHATPRSHLNLSLNHLQS